MSLHYLVKLKMLISQSRMLSCHKKKLQNLSHLNYGLQVRQIWIHLTLTCGNIARQRVQNTHHWYGAIDDATDEWLPQWRRDPAWPSPTSVAVSVRPDQWCVFWTPSLAIFPTPCNQVDSNLANFDATVKIKQILKFLSLTTQW